MTEKHDRACGAERDKSCGMSCRCWCHIGGRVRDWAWLLSTLWPGAALLALLVVGVWAAQARRGLIEATTIICPTCGGLGRLNREPPATAPQPRLEE